MLMHVTKKELTLVLFITEMTPFDELKDVQLKLSPERSYFGAKILTPFLEE